MFLSVNWNIATGMQALFETSEEAPGEKGLGIFPGAVKRFPRDLRDADGQVLKVPHIGWNQIDSRHPVFEDQEWFYFVHSFYCVPADESLVAATTDYGGRFCSAIARDNGRSKFSMLCRNWSEVNAHRCSN